MVPDLRPSSPLSTGPTLFLASSPTAWQGRHFLNASPPAATSWAKAAPADAASAAAVSIKIPVMIAPFKPISGEQCPTAMVAVTPGNLDDRLLGRCQRVGPFPAKNIPK